VVRLDREVVHLLGAADELSDSRWLRDRVQTRFRRWHRRRCPVETGKAFVEASYRIDGDTVEVFGSSTTNAEGHYIAWKEVLRRTA
jgi:hypothetical protein